MKISVVAPHFHPETGGMETNILEVGKRLAAKGHEFEVHTSRVTTRGKMLSAAEKTDGISIFRYKPVFSFGYYATLIKPEIKSFDVLHLHAFGYYSHNRLISKYRGSPIVFTPHHGASMPRGGGILDSLFHRYYNWAFGRRLQYLARIVMMTENEKDWYIQRRFPQEHLVAIPSGVGDEAFERTDAAETLGKYGLSADNYILYLGRLHPEKSVDHLIDAFDGLCDHYPDLKLVLAGPDDGAMDNLRAQVKGNAVERRVAFTGRVSEAQKRALLGNCAVFVLPSRFEAEGVVLLEAMAQGRAVLASKVGGVPFIVSSGRTGELYPYGKINDISFKLREMLDSPQKREKLGRAGLEFVRKNYRWDSIAERMEAMYESAIADMKAVK